MDEKPMIAVVGATGAQGGGLVRALLDNGTYAVRGLTRDVTSDKAKALSAMGVDVVAAELDDVASLKAAFQGTYGAFFVTNFWEHGNAAKETQQFRNLADAAKAAGVKHVVSSTIEDAREHVKAGSMPLLQNGQNQYYVPHGDGKGEATPYVMATCPATSLLTSFYYENFVNLGMGPQQGPDGTWSVSMPMDDKRLPMVAAADIGKFAALLFEDEAYIGRTVGLAGDALTLDDIAKVFSDVLEKRVEYRRVSREDYAKQASADLANMFQWHVDCNELYVGNRDVATARGICPDLQSLKSWVKKHKAAFA